jgi:hypothetical protein
VGLLVSKGRQNGSDSRLVGLLGINHSAASIIVGKKDGEETQ